MKCLLLLLAICISSDFSYAGDGAGWLVSITFRAKSKAVFIEPCKSDLPKNKKAVFFQSWDQAYAHGLDVFWTKLREQAHNLGSTGKQQELIEGRDRFDSQYKDGLRDKPVHFHYLPVFGSLLPIELNPAIQGLPELNGNILEVLWYVRQGLDNATIQRDFNSEYQQDFTYIKVNKKISSMRTKLGFKGKLRQDIIIWTYNEGVFKHQNLPLFKEKGVFYQNPYTFKKTPEEVLGDAAGLIKMIRLIRKGNTLKKVQQKMKLAKLESVFVYLSRVMDKVEFRDVNQVITWAFEFEDLDPIQ